MRGEAEGTAKGPTTHSSRDSMSIRSETRSKKNQSKLQQAALITRAASLTAGHSAVKEGKELFSLQVFENKFDIFLSVTARASRT